MRSMRSSGEQVTICADPASPQAFLCPYSLLLDYVNEPDQFPKAPP